MLIIWLGDLDSSLSDIFDTKKPVPVKVSNQTNLLNLINLDMVGINGSVNFWHRLCPLWFCESGFKQAANLLRFVLAPT